MNSHDWLCVGLALGVTLATTPLVRTGARRVGMIAKPRADRWHKKPTALLGGIAIFLGVAAGDLVSGIPLRENLWFYLGGVFVFCLGLIDDIHHIRPAQKLVGQIFAAVALIMAGTVLSWTPLHFINYALTFIWIIGITNAINLLDNMDGLAAGISLIASVFFALLLWQNGERTWSLLSVSLAASLAGFLVFNSNPASIFMGDCGALFIGYVLSAVSLHATSSLDMDCSLAPIAIPVLVLAVPIFDTTFVTILRKLAGRPASQGGRDHTSHRLVALGWSERQAVWILYGFAALSGGAAMLTRNAPIDVALAAILLMVCVIIFLGIHLAAVVTYSEEEFQLARQKKVWIACWWQAAHWRLLERILDSCLILLVWRWDCRLVIDTSSASELAFLLGAAILLAKLACLSAFSLYRESWSSLRWASLARLAMALAIGELVGFILLVLASVGASSAAIISLFDFGVLLALMVGLRFLYPSLCTLIRLKQK